MPFEFRRSTPADAVPSCTHHTGYVTPDMLQVYPQGPAGPRVNPRIRVAPGAPGVAGAATAPMLV